MSSLFHDPDSFPDPPFALINLGTIASYHLNKKPVAVKNCRKIGKKDMKLNSATPVITVHPETYRVGQISIFS